MSAYLEVAGLEKNFGGLRALNDCSFTIAKGRITDRFGWLTHVPSAALVR